MLGGIPFVCCCNVPWNALWSFKVLIDACQLFQIVPLQYTKPHLNRSILGRVIAILCECLFWSVRKLAIRVEGAHPVVSSCISTPLLYSRFNLSGRTSNDVVVMSCQSAGFRKGQFTGSLESALSVLALAESKRVGAQSMVD